MTRLSKFSMMVAGSVTATLLIACEAGQSKTAVAAEQGDGGGGARHVAKVVRDSAELLSALRSAQGGDKILLAPGTYSPISVQKINFSDSGVTIASADLANPAKVVGVELSNVAGLAFEYLDVTHSARALFNIIDSRNIRLSGMNLHGQPASLRDGVLIQRSRNVTIDNSDLHDTGTGIRVYASDHVTLSGMTFHDVRGDGIQGSASSNVTITGNHFTDFYSAPGDHPDMIQFFTLNQKAPVHDLVITDNTFVRGAGNQVQGVFLGNEAELPYMNVTIKGNKLVGASYQGIAVFTGQNVTITNNIVQAFADQGSWINVTNTTNATVTDNQASSYVYDKGNSGLKFKKNKELRAAKVGDLSILQAVTKDN